MAARARAAGMPILGHTHTGPWTRDDTCPQTANPWKRSKCVGGSSGGSAAAVAVAARGADASARTPATSVRNPACNTGVGTIKPTYGLIPLYGVTPLTVSNDHAGPICRSMTDVALLLGVLAGPDPLDPRSLQAPPAPAYYPMSPRPGDKPLEGVRIGSTIETEPSPAKTAWAPGILAQLRAAVEQFRALGATIVEVTPAGLQPRQHDLLQGRLDRPVHRRSVSASTIYGNSENAYVLKDTYAQTAATRCSSAASRRASAAPPPVNGVEGKDQLVQRAAKYTPEDLFGAYQVRREYCEAWAKVFADNDLHACLWPQKVQTPPDRADDFTGGFSGVESSRPNTTGWPCVDVPVGRDANTGIPVGIDIAAPLGGRPRRPADRDRLPGALPLPPRRPDRALAMADPTNARHALDQQLLRLAALHHQGAAGDPRRGRRCCRRRRPRHRPPLPSPRPP